MCKRKVVAFLLLVPGCTTVPPLEENGIAISEIVQRVKCEIAWAVPAPQHPYPSGSYQWMRHWTAKAELTLSTNAKSTISPTALFTHFLPSVPVSGVGNIGRSVTLGTGAGLETSADRTEVMTFTVSLAEMLRFKQRGDCDLPDARGVYGNLGLQEWIRSAITPVDRKQLRIGRHAQPGGKSPAPPPVVPIVPFAIDSPLAPLIKAAGDVEHYAAIAKAELANATLNATRDDIQPTYDNAALIYGALNNANQIKSLADDTLVPQLLAQHPELKEKIATQAEALKKAHDRILAAKDKVDDILKALPRDPPIDSLSHSVKFVVALSGNVSPNWVLVNARGPTVSGNLLSGTYTRTHTLSIAMGSPSEQSRQLNNLVIIQNLRPNP